MHVIRVIGHYFSPYYHLTAATLSKTQFFKLCVSGSIICISLFRLNVKVMCTCNYQKPYYRHLSETI